MKTELEEATLNFTAGKSVKEIYSRMDFIKGSKFGAKWQQEQDKNLYSEEDMINFAWFLLKNIGQYSDDRLAHFEGEYLKQFKRNK